MHPRLTVAKSPITRSPLSLDPEVRLDYDSLNNSNANNAKAEIVTQLESGNRTRDTGHGTQARCYGAIMNPAEEGRTRGSASWLGRHDCVLRSGSEGGGRRAGEDGHWGMGVEGRGSFRLLAVSARRSQSNFKRNALYTRAPPLDPKTPSHGRSVFAPIINVQHPTFNISTLSHCHKDYHEAPPRAVHIPGSSLIFSQSCTSATLDGPQGSTRLWSLR